MFNVCVDALSIHGTLIAILFLSRPYISTGCNGSSNAYYLLIRTSVHMFSPIAEFIIGLMQCRKIAVTNIGGREATWNLSVIFSLLHHIIIKDINHTPGPITIFNRLQIDAVSCHRSPKRFSQSTTHPPTHPPCEGWHSVRYILSSPQT